MGKLFVALLTAAVLNTAAVPSTTLMSEVAAAIRANDFSELHRLVTGREAANAANGIGMTPLHYAALYGSPEAIDFLLKAGADPAARNQSGATPLVYAAWSYDRTRLLLEQNRSLINVATKEGVTPLLVASAAHGNVATVRLLLDKGAVLSAQTAEGEDALMRASASGDSDMVQLLLARGADAKLANKAGFTALQNATSVPDSERLQMLLRAGADPNSFNTFAGQVKNGPIALRHLTPLMTAAAFSDAQTIDCLLKAGAHVNESDSRKMTPLMLSIATDHANPATVRRLINAGADLQAIDIYGDSALDWARKYNNPEIVSMLVSAGARAHELPHIPSTPAHQVSDSSTESVKLALTLFGKSDFFRAGGGCSGCHHQPIQARAYASVRNTAFAKDAGLRKVFLDSVLAIRPRLAGRLPVFVQLWRRL